MLLIMTAPVQIRKDDVVRDIRELASLKRKPITEAVAEAVRSELERERRNCDVDQRRRKVRQIVDALHRLPRTGPPLTDEDLYDEDGLPR
jgi:hypothetical protein